MAQDSKIEWTDHTFNPWIGCTKVSPGCANCYAENQDARWHHTAEGWGKGKPRKRTSAANWKKPLQWNQQAEKEGKRVKVFCASLADWLDDEVPVEWLANLLELIFQTPHLDWQLLTKRPENFTARIYPALFYLAGYRDGQSQASPTQEESLHLKHIIAWYWENQPPPNVWIGTSVEDQQRAEERIPALLDIPAAKRFLSCEPLLGPVDLRLTAAAPMGSLAEGRIDWVIVGGESGPSARPMAKEWAAAIKDECLKSQVAFLFKQWGEHDEGGNRVGKKKAGRLLNGQEWNQFPN